MILFDDFTMEGKNPIYQQIVIYLKRRVAAGSITNGDELPSRRMLSALLSVNPNTVQKAYRILEEEGLIQSHSGAKSVMVVDEETIARIRGQLAEEEAGQLVSAMRAMGISREEAHRLIDRYWENG
ncbi:MAG: GntR family transcriptional regulator [Lachnospiraceae bacterium]|nr:GntR family transcriptional regulator [Lachnospiraceae bacterium]